MIIATCNVTLVFTKKWEETTAEFHILKAHAFNILVVLLPVFHLVKLIRELLSGGI